MAIKDDLASLNEENKSLRSRLGLKDRSDDAKDTLEWLEKENEMLRVQSEVAERCSKLFETEDGRKQALFALQYFYSIPLPLWVSDSNANIKFWNRYAERTYHHSEDKAIGKNFIDLFVSKPEKQQASDDLLAIIHGQEGLEHFNLCKDLNKENKQVYLVTCCFPVFDPRAQEIVQAEISFDLQRLPELIDELDEMYQKYKKNEEEAAKLRAEKERAIIAKETQQLLDELRSVFARASETLEAKIRTSRALIDGKSMPAERRVEERKLDAHLKAVAALGKWEKEVKVMINTAPGTLSELERIREIILKGFEFKPSR